ncbi:MAG: hypothetical protein RLY57_142 [Candidatus Parcubacteria bacterium]|jgi:hypothetical protein
MEKPLREMTDLEKEHQFQMLKQFASALLDIFEPLMECGWVGDEQTLPKGAFCAFD